MNNFNWKILNTYPSSRARTGLISTPHGKIYTPAFIFCGTKGALKSINVEDAKKCGTQIILSNTYHLMLQPGADIISAHGGLHKFMNWSGPMLTDSGGFQIFSLGHGFIADEIKGRNINTNKKKSLIKITEEGALFQSYIDGSKHLLTPEKSISIQRDIGADLILVFDECTPYHVDKTYTAESMLRSHRWAVRSIDSFNANNVFVPRTGSAGPQALYGIIQGGVYEDLRNESIEFNLNNSDYFGFAIGGSLGSSKEQMHEIVKYTSSKLKITKPVHLLGIGDSNDIWNFVEYGIDTFDCVSPTRLARHGAALTRTFIGKINIKNSKYFDLIQPIDASCKCMTCSKYSLSYLHHLFKSDELLAFQLVTIHNIFFMNSLMHYIRKSINENNFDKAKNNWYLK